jgi:hypothetical protein
MKAKNKMRLFILTLPCFVSPICLAEIPVEGYSNEEVQRLFSNALDENTLSAQTRSNDAALVLPHHFQPNKPYALVARLPLKFA